MNSRFIFVFAACTAVMMAQDAVSAQSTGASVQIIKCMASMGRPALTWTNVYGGHEASPPTPPHLMVDFQNVSNKPIKSVEFGLVRGGSVVAMALDVGMFDPSADIMHALAIPPGTLHGDTSGTCVPLRITYADGTTWTNPALPAKPADSP